MTRGFNGHSDNSISKWQEVYYFLLSGRKKYNNIGDWEWNNKCQLDHSKYYLFNFFYYTIFYNVHLI